MEVRNHQLYNGGQEKRIQLKLNYFFSETIEKLKQNSD